jgi:dihydroxy-acid dehydratase
VSTERPDGRRLRSNYEYGSFHWAVRRAQWRALGIGDDDLDKPKIAVVNSSSELASCFSHLDGLAEIVKEAIRAAGGLAFEIRTAAPSDFITSRGGRGGYILSARDLIPNDIEVVVEGAQLDGMVCLGSCDKTTPGQLMAAARLDIPTLIAIGGYQASGELDGEHVDIEDVFLYSMHVLTGKMPVERLDAMSAAAVRSPGVCTGMGTANSMHLVCEALGMTLPGAAPVAAGSERMETFARRSGERIVEMVYEDLTPRRILTEAAFANAAKVVLAVSGSINCVKHLQAVAVETGRDIDVYDLFERFDGEVPVLAAVRPVGGTSTEAFEAAGGAAGVLKQLEPMLDTGVLTATGATLAENLASVQVADADVIRPLSDPVSREPGIVILRGSLAPATAILKLGVDPGKQRHFEGTAIVFESQEEALDGLRAGRIRAGHVVVLRGQGVTGSPGMGMASRIVFALDGADLGADVAVVTDGQLSGLVNKGLVVGEVSPEAAAGGPIGLVRDGDAIVIDVERRVVELEVGEDELAARRATLAATAPAVASGWLAIYARNVAPLPDGAVLTNPPRP